jgi:hypothetical protein
MHVWPHINIPIILLLLKHLSVITFHLINPQSRVILMMTIDLLPPVLIDKRQKALMWITLKSLSLLPLYTTYTLIRITDDKIWLPSGLITILLLPLLTSLRSLAMLVQHFPLVHACVLLILWDHATPHAVREAGILLGRVVEVVIAVGLRLRLVNLGVLLH